MKRRSVRNEDESETSKFISHQKKKHSRENGCSKKLLVFKGIHHNSSTRGNGDATKLQT